MAALRMASTSFSCVNGLDGAHSLPANKDLWLSVMNCNSLSSV